MVATYAWADEPLIIMATQAAFVLLKKKAQIVFIKIFILDQDEDHVISSTKQMLLFAVEVKDGNVVQLERSY